MSPREQFLQLKESAPIILPSMLACDFANLVGEVSQLSAAGIGALHLDVMDGSFVPNLTYGMPVVEALRRTTEMPIDAHLMIVHPEKYIEAFVTAGANAVTIHREAVADPVPVLDQIRELGAAAGIAINPGTAVSELESCRGHVDLVLIMSVEAGFGGQSFQPSALDRLGEARDMFGPEVLLQIDGGINHETIGESATAGAELLVVGSAIFKQPDYSTAIQQLENQVRQVRA